MFSVQLQQIQFFRQFSAEKYLQNILPEEGRDGYTPSLEKRGFEYFHITSARSNGGKSAAFGLWRAANTGVQGRETAQVSQSGEKGQVYSKAYRWLMLHSMNSLKIQSVFHWCHPSKQFAKCFQYDISLQIHMQNIFVTCREQNIFKNKFRTCTSKVINISLTLMNLLVPVLCS